MMTAHGFYRIIIFLIPLYISMFIGYGSVKWWKLFNQEQCTGISRFCTLFAVPVLSFFYIMKSNLNEMNLKLLVADVLQKVIVLLVLVCWYKLSPKGSIDQLITIFSICTQTNALILGIPVLRSMYPAIATPLLVEIFLAQIVIWHPLLLIMYEYRAAKIVTSFQFGDTHSRDIDIEIATIDRKDDAGGISSIYMRAEEVDATNVPDGGGGREDSVIHFHLEGHMCSHDQPSAGNEQGEIEEATSSSKVIPETNNQHMSNRPTSVPSTSMMTKRILIMVWKKIIENPNTYPTMIGLIWLFVSSKFHIKMPMIVTRSATFLSNASLGMGMFNMGLSMGMRPAFIPCSKVVAALTIILRFIIGPIVMVLASVVVGLRGIIFRIAIVQASLCQGVVPSIFAVQYNVYPEVFGIGMTLGMVVALPVALVYHILLEIQC